MKSVNAQITECIEKAFDFEGRNFSNNIIVFPCGDIGIQTVEIMKNIYGLEPAYIIDNHKYNFTSTIKNVSFLDEVNINDYVLILCSVNEEIYDELKKEVYKWEEKNRLFELDIMKNSGGKIVKYPRFKTEIGKYSYGPLCRNHCLINKIGSFCSFAEGTDVVANHEQSFLTTHPLIYAGHEIENLEYDYSLAQRDAWYFEGITPRNMVRQNRRITIGNDVWFGRNVIVTNSSNIGNGVIAGAGSVITRDVPDYAVVAGVPAKIIRYRYSPDQIEALNHIAWWDWSDSDIRDRFDDFYLPIDSFIDKYT